MAMGDASQAREIALRNGEQRTYKAIARLYTSRPHTVLVYYKDVLVAQIAKNEIVKITHQDGN